MAKATAKKKSIKKKTAHRASWKGQLTFGLVSFPVEAYNVHDRSGSDIHFHQIHAKCHNRIKYQKVCPVHGEVPNDEIVSGYEHKKDEYIEIDPDDLDALRKPSDRALKIEAFVSPAAIDTVYFDGRMYYLAPDGAVANEPYAVIAEAMQTAERYGVGHLIMSGKDQIVLVRPLDGVLQMAMLNYEAEIRTPKSVVTGLKKLGNISKQVRLAQTLIDQWSDDKFDFSSYEDTHREDVEKLIQVKLRKAGSVKPDKDEVKEEEEEEVLDLMEALKKSVSQVKTRTSVLGKRKRK